MGVIRDAFRAVGGSILYGVPARDVLDNTGHWTLEAPWTWWRPGDGDVLSSTGGPPGAAAGGALRMMGHPGIARATSLVVDPIVSMPWHCFTNADDLSQRLRVPTPRWITDPQNAAGDRRVSSSRVPGAFSGIEFWSQVLMSALLEGDGFVYVPQRDWDGSPKPPLFVLNPEHVDYREAEGGYFVADERVPDERIIHLRGAGPYIEGRGQGVLRRHASRFGLHMQVETYANGTYRSTVPSGYLKTSAPNLTEPEAARIRAKWESAHGSASRSVAVLNATTEYHPIEFSPVDAALVDMNKWGLQDIALAFGLESSMLGVSGDSSTYANVESRLIQYRTHTLLIWTRRLEERLDLELPGDVSLKVAMEGLLRADTKTRYQAHNIALDRWLTPNEVRALEDMPPLSDEELAEMAERQGGSSEVPTGEREREE